MAFPTTTTTIVNHRHNHLFTMLGLGFLFHFYNPPSPPPQTTPTTPNYRILFNQATTICNTNPLHFIIISILFIPLTFSTAAALELYIFSADVTTILQTLTTFKTLTTLILVIISTVTGVSLTTYTAYQTIRRTPVTFTSIFKSLPSSFIPLLSTFVAGMIKLALISLVIALFGLWFHFKQLMISFVLVLTLVFYMITWGLAPAIAVLESKSDFKTLRECAKYKSAMFCSKFLYMVCNTGVLIWGIFYYCAYYKKTESLSNCLVFVVASAIYKITSLVIMHYVVASTVLYVQAKAARVGGVSGEDMRELMDGGFSRMYMVFHMIIVISFVMLF